MALHRGRKNRRNFPNDLEEEIHFVYEELERKNRRKIQSFNGKLHPSLIDIAIKSYVIKVSEESSLPDEIRLLHGLMANQGTAQQKHGLFTSVPYEIWKSISDISLNEMTRILAVKKIAEPLGLYSKDKDSFVLNTRKKRGKILHDTLEKIIEVFSEAPDFVDMRQFFGGLEYNILVEKGYKKEADFLFNVPLPIFVQAMALYLMDSYTFRQRTVRKFKKTFLGKELRIAGGENYFVNLRRLIELGLSLKELSRPDRSYSTEEIRELIEKGVIITALGQQKFSKENLYEYEWAYIRSEEGYGTSDSKGFAFASLILGPWGPLVLRLHDTLDTIVKGVDDYTYDRYRELLDEADKRYGNIFRIKYGIDFSSNFGEFDEVLAASMLVKNEKVKEIFLKMLEKRSIETFIYLIAKNNSVINDYFRSSIGMRHAHRIKEEIDHLILGRKNGGNKYLNGNKRVTYDIVTGEDYYPYLVNNPLFNMLSLGQLQPFDPDIPIDWDFLLFIKLAGEFYSKLDYLNEKKLLPDRRILDLKDYPYDPGFIGNVSMTGFPGLLKSVMRYF